MLEDIGRTIQWWKLMQYVRNGKSNLLTGDQKEIKAGCYLVMHYESGKVTVIQMRWGKGMPQWIDLPLVRKGCFLFVPTHKSPSTVL